MTTYVLNVHTRALPCTKLEVMFMVPGERRDGVFTNLQTPEAGSDHIGRGGEREGNEL